MAIVWEQVQVPDDWAVSNLHGLIKSVFGSKKIHVAFGELGTLRVDDYTKSLRVRARSASRGHCCQLRWRRCSFCVLLLVASCLLRRSRS
jgi:hypothetical protein